MEEEKLKGFAMPMILRTLRASSGFGFAAQVRLPIRDSIRRVLFARNCGRYSPQNAAARVFRGALLGIVLGCSCNLPVDASPSNPGNVIPVEPTPHPLPEGEQRIERLPPMEIIGNRDDTLSIEVESALSSEYSGERSSGLEDSGGEGTPSDPGKDGAKDKCTETTENPVNIASGNKLKTETDFRTQHLQPISLVRRYNYSSNRQGLFGVRWSSNFDRSLGFTLLQGTYCAPRPGQDATACIGPNIISKVTLARGDGSQTTYDLAREHS